MKLPQVALLPKKVITLNNWLILEEATQNSPSFSRPNCEKFIIPISKLNI